MPRLRNRNSKLLSKDSGIKNIEKVLNSFMRFSLLETQITFCFL